MIVKGATKARSSNDVAESCGNDAYQRDSQQSWRNSSKATALTFPDIQAHRQTWSAEKQANGDEEHVGHNMFKSQRDKGKYWPPHTDRLGRYVLGLQAEID